MRSYIMAVAFVGLKVLCVKVGINEIQGRYQCDFYNPCLCPYDDRFIQTFETHQDYKMHLLHSHGMPPISKRSNGKEYEPKEIIRRQEATRRQHANGSFRNTHVKRETLVHFIDLYDKFLKNLFRSQEYVGFDFKEAWDTVFRISKSDLEESTLEELIEEIENGSRERPSSRRARLRRYEELYNDLY